MNKDKLIYRFFNTVSYYAIGNIIVSVLSFLLIPFLTRQISIDDLGKIFLFQSTMVIATAIIALGSQSVVQSVYHRELANISKYIGGSLFNAFVMLISVLIIVSTIIGVKISNLIGIDLIYIKIAVLFAFFNFVQSLVHSLLQVREEAKTFLFMTSVASIIGFLSTISFLVFFDLDWRARILGIGSMLLISFIIGGFLLIGIGISFPSLSEIKELLFIGNPIVFHSIAMLFINQTDKLLLASLKTTAEVGLYGVAAQLGSIVTVFGATLGMAYTPIIYKNIEAKLMNEYKQMVKLRFYCMLANVIFGFLIMITILNFNEFILGEEFQFPFIVFIILVMSYIFFSWYNLNSGYFYYYKQTKKLASLTVTIAVLNALISYMLIPRFGILGAAAGTLIAYILGWYSAHSFSRKKDKAQFAFYKSLIYK